MYALRFKVTRGYNTTNQNIEVWFNDVGFTRVNDLNAVDLIATRAQNSSGWQTDVAQANDTDLDTLVNLHSVILDLILDYESATLKMDFYEMLNAKLERPSLIRIDLSANSIPASGPKS